MLIKPAGVHAVLSIAVVALGIGCSARAHPPANSPPGPMPAANPQPTGAGRRCEGEDNLREAALTAFAKRTRPAILEKAKLPRSEHAFGDPDYARLMLSQQPIIVAIEDTPEQPLGDLPPELAPRVVAVGSASDLDPVRRHASVQLSLRTQDTPTDGAMLLVHIIDRQSCNFVMAYRIVHG